MQNPRSPVPSWLNTRLVLSLLVLMLLVLNVGCATQTKPIASRPLPQLKQPELPQSARPQQRPQICSEACSSSIAKLLDELAKLDDKSAQTLTRNSSLPLNAPKDTMR